MPTKYIRDILTAPWPFAVWGIDMIGEIKPTPSNGHRFNLVTIDYFTKWVKAASFASVTKNVVARFIKQNLICRCGISDSIITDNGTILNLTMITALSSSSFECLDSSLALCYVGD